MALQPGVLVAAGGDDVMTGRREARLWTPLDCRWTLDTQ